MISNSYVEMDFSGFKEAVRAYRLAKSIGMIGQHKVRRCIQCRMVVPALVSVFGTPRDTNREYYFCDYTDRHPQVQHLFADEGEWIEGVTPLACADGRFYSCIDGGYPVLFIDRCGDTFCNECASDPTVAQLWDDEVCIKATMVFYEGPAESCSNCSTLIESAYGDPDNPEED